MEGGFVVKSRLGKGSTSVALLVERNGHPWSIGGGGAADLKEALEDAVTTTLAQCIADIGRTTHTGEDNVFFVPADFCRRFGLSDRSVALVEGECVQDHQIDPLLSSLMPYDLKTGNVRSELPDEMSRHFWVFRIPMRKRMDFGNYIEDRGLLW